MTTAENKAGIKWERLSILNGLAYTVAYVQRILCKYKPATPGFSIAEEEKAKAIIFKLLQREVFGEEVKSLKVGKKGPKKQQNSRIFIFGAKGRTYWSERENR